MSTPLNTPSAWRNRRLRVLALVLTVALLVLGVLMHFKPSALRGATGAAQMAGEAPAASPETAASSPTSPFWSLVAQASARADSAEADKPLDLRRWEADWCAKHGGRVEALAPEQLQLLLESKEVQQAAAALKAQGRSRLQALRTHRSVAALEALDAFNDSAEAGARLREHARRSDDPFVLALALQSACSDAACQRELSRR